MIIVVDHNVISRSTTSFGFWIYLLFRHVVILLKGYIDYKPFYYGWETIHVSLLGTLFSILNIYSRRITGAQL
jgi:hypothetical protein